ncbi:hypothetical protein BS47DRAFT_1396085 [Hydnum rufescens UP504]|uniref:Actin-like ATPase domain-containing protein n=1 Tax=Hydnum rufescens UP504 TaxID=1448309 RepID=A0A9P6AQV3_9AGAM|nr:hypothetical protein BS47DRAFT_1396085 [Hydnum rufescens UP504]
MEIHTKYGYFKGISLISVSASTTWAPHAHVSTPLPTKTVFHSALQIGKRSHPNPTVSMTMPNAPQSVINHAYYERGFNGSRTKPFSSRGPFRNSFRTFKFQWEGVTICDAGGATVDLATYNVLRASGAPEIVEAAPRSGSCSGASFLDLHFRQPVQERLAAHPVHLDEASLAHFMRSFSQSEKLDYKGAKDDTKLFRFRCLHDEYLDDPAVGLDHGELVIPGDVLCREVFDPVVEQVLHSIAAQVQASKVHLDVLLLVGGFSANEYLFQCITQQFGSSIVSVIRPADGDIAPCRGGVRFDVGSPISSVIQPQNVFRRVALPTELENRTMRPAYITSVAGRSFCEVEYIVRGGTSVMKGSSNELRVRKLCSSRYDRTLDIVLYASNVEEIKRYFDEEKTYPSFLEQVEASPFGKFYVDFVLGFEMDTAGEIIIACLP